MQIWSIEPTLNKQRTFNQYLSFAVPNSVHLVSRTETLVRGHQVQLVCLPILRNLFMMNLGRVGTNPSAVAGQKKTS